MTTPESATTTTRPSAVAHGSPIDTNGPRISLYSAEFAANPHEAYREMRKRYGSLVPVELAPGVPATLVIGYYTALQILNDPDHFPHDSRNWQQGVPEDCPVRPMLEWRPAAIRSAGLEHTRYREATVAGLGVVDLFALHSTVEKIATPLINTFCQEGVADLVGQYALPLAFTVINAILGCPQEISQRAAAGMAALMEGGEAAVEGNKMVMDAMFELIQLKRDQPGDDIVSGLLAHSAKLDDPEMIHQVLSLFGAGMEPTQNLIVNTLRLMLTDTRFGGGILGGTMSTRDALDEVLFTDPPLSNYCITFPRQPILIEGSWLPAHQPVVVSMTGSNNDPAITTGEYTDNSSHLAWSVGPHACPARSIASLIAQDAIDQLLDALPEMRLAVSVEELEWRPGPFHRALVALPITFPKSPPLQVF
ncbi:cytochrome P450 [Nocardia vinacea]|uniref:cytochrome P450 n=1 Tax=Nocardia vinacea TaxID=96468 RepID=UPI002E12F9C4|nr:cytochrome P450 [Nocardia vinacea]